VYSMKEGRKGGVGEQTLSDDGVAFTNYQPKPGLAKRLVTKRALDKLMKDSPDLGYLSDEFLMNAGFRPPASAREFTTGSAQSRISWMLGRGAVVAEVSDATLDGAKMTRVDLIADNPDHELLRKLPQKQTYSFILDPQMNYAVRRVEQRYGNQLVYVTRNEDFQKLSGRDLWLPRKSYTDYYTYFRIPDQFFDRPILTQVREVAKIDLNAIPHERFVLTPEIPPSEQAQLAAAAVEAPPDESKPSAVATAPPPRTSQVSSWLTSPAAIIIALAGLLLLAIFGRLALRAMSKRGR
jgi:hypothetical protein